MINTVRPQIEIAHPDVLFGYIGMLGTWLIALLIPITQGRSLGEVIMWGGLCGGVVAVIVFLIIWFNIDTDSIYVNFPLPHNFRIVKEYGVYYRLECRFLRKWYKIASTPEIIDEAYTIAELKGAYRALREEKAVKDGGVVYKGRV